MGREGVFSKGKLEIQGKVVEERTILLGLDQELCIKSYVVESSHLMTEDKPKILQDLCRKSYPVRTDLKDLYSKGMRFRGLNIQQVFPSGKLIVLRLSSP